MAGIIDCGVFIFSGHKPEVKTAVKYVSRCRLSLDADTDAVTRPDDSETVDLYVGRDHKHFSINKKLLCERSKYFKKMFCGRFREASTNCAIFPEDDVESFEVLLEWICSDKLPELADFEQHAGDPASSEPKGWKWNAIHAYALADKFCIPRLMDMIMNAIVCLDFKQSTLPGEGHMLLAYNLTPPNSPLRYYHLMAFGYAMHELRHMADWPMEPLVEILHENAEFVADYARTRRLYSGAMHRDPTDRWLCAWHGHAPGAPCEEFRCRAEDL